MILNLYKMKFLSYPLSMKKAAENQTQLYKNVKGIAILIAVITVITFLYCSLKLYRFKESNTAVYQARFSVLNAYEKTVATAMEKTGEIEAKLTSRPERKGGYNIFDDISNSHKK